MFSRHWARTGSPGGGEAANAREYAVMPAMTIAALPANLRTRCAFRLRFSCAAAAQDPVSSASWWSWPPSAQVVRINVPSGIPNSSLVPIVGPRNPFVMRGSLSGVSWKTMTGQQRLEAENYSWRFDASQAPGPAEVLQMARPPSALVHETLPARLRMLLRFGPQM